MSPARLNVPMLIAAALALALAASASATGNHDEPRPPKLKDLLGESMIVGDKRFDFVSFYGDGIKSRDIRVAPVDMGLAGIGFDLIGPWELPEEEDDDLRRLSNTRNDNWEEEEEPETQAISFTLHYNVTVLDPNFVITDAHLKLIGAAVDDGEEDEDYLTSRSGGRTTTTQSFFNFPWPWPWPWPGDEQEEEPNFASIVVTETISGLNLDLDMDAEVNTEGVEKTMDELFFEDNPQTTLEVWKTVTLTITEVDDDDDHDWLGSFINHGFRWNDDYRDSHWDDDWFDWEEHDDRGPSASLFAVRQTFSQQVVPAPAALPTGLALLGLLIARRRRHAA